MLSISTRFFPIRLSAFLKNSVEMEVHIENKSGKEKWVECDVHVPDAISLASDRQLSKGRIRVGIIKPNEVLIKKVKIFGGASSYPDLYPIRLMAYGFGEGGIITTRAEKESELRCERIKIE